MAEVENFGPNTTEGEGLVMRLLGEWIITIMGVSMLIL